jgi:hypothetical protein
MPGQYMQRAKPFYDETTDEIHPDTTTCAPFKKPPTVNEGIIIEDELII